MNVYILSKKFSGWKASSRELMEMLGYPDGRVPVLGHTRITIQGIEVWITSLLAAQRTRTRVTAKPHRVMALCPVCGKAMSAGRLQQHSKIHRIIHD